MAVPDVGQAQVTAFVNAATSGELKYEPGTAEKVVKIYDNVIHGLLHQRERASRLAKLSGFGGFPSAQELQTGFERKAMETVAYIDSLIESYYRMQYAFLLAGKAYPEADQRNRDALQQAADQKLGLANQRATFLDEDNQALQGMKASRA